MKHEIHITKSETEELDVIVDKCRIYRNSHGNLCIHFHTPNHKYVSYWSSGGSGMIREFHYYFGTDYESVIQIKLIPENEEEIAELDQYIDGILWPEKYEHRLILLKMEDIYSLDELAMFRQSREKARLRRESRKELTDSELVV
jgi:hypothetical protein